MVDVVDFKAGVASLNTFTALLLDVNFLLTCVFLNFCCDFEKAFCSNFHCAEVDVRPNEAATKFHSDSLRRAASHEAVEDEIAGIG